MVESEEMREMMEMKGTGWFQTHQLELTSEGFSPCHDVFFVPYCVTGLYNASLTL